MTASREIVESALNREEVDRVPFFPPFQGYWALADAGLKTIDSINDPKQAAEAQMRVVSPCGIDAVEVLWDWMFPVEALGCKVKIPEFGTIGTKTHVVNEPGDVDKLELPDLDKFYRSASAKATAELLSNSLGKDHYLTASILGPFTLAGELRGVDNLLYDSLVDEDFVTALLKKATELDKEIVEFICQWDIDAVLTCDPTTSGDLMSPEDFDKFSQRHLREVGDVIRGAGKDFIIHMCGSTSDRLDQIADTGCKAFSCDSCVDIHDAVSRMAERMAIIGNIDPTAVLYMGTPENVISETTRILNEGGRRGFLLGSGCDVPVGSKFENVRAISEAISRF